MPYYLKTDDRDLLRKLCRTQRCSECGSELVAFWDAVKKLPYLQCRANAEHEGIGKPNKQQENNYEGGLRQMQQVEQQHGVDKARQLAKYQGVTSLTRQQALEIMETIWPNAPAVDKTAAAMLCVSYGLNPLANHVFLIPFEDKKTGVTTWTRVWGIRAKRLVASRRGAYCYLDMTPRLMTDDEQVKVWGAVDETSLCYITILRDMKSGAEASGFGKWPKNEIPKGTSKGNSQANMASIRSESQALDRLRPAEMPSGFVVADELREEQEYIEGEGKVINTEIDSKEEPQTNQAKTQTNTTSTNPPSPCQGPTNEELKTEVDPHIEVDDILQQLADARWNKIITLTSWLTGEPLRIPIAVLAGKTLREVVEFLNHDQRLALCSVLRR